MIIALDGYDICDWSATYPVEHINATSDVRAVYSSVSGTVTTVLMAATVQICFYLILVVATVNAFAGNFYSNVTTLRSGLRYRKYVCLSVCNVGALYSGD